MHDLLCKSIWIDLLSLYKGYNFLVRLSICCFIYERLVFADSLKFFVRWTEAKRAITQSTKYVKGSPYYLCSLIGKNWKIKWFCGISFWIEHNWFKSFMKLVLIGIVMLISREKRLHRHFGISWSIQYTYIDLIGLTQSG